MSLIPEIELIYKTCRTCEEIKELNCYRPSARVCKQCISKYDRTKKERMKRFYINHKEFLKQDNLDRYYRNKLNKEQHNESLFIVA